MSFPYQHITIIGLGLMGGAFAKALSAIDGVTVFGVTRSEKAIDFAKEKGWISDGSTLISDILPDTDLVLLCGPTWTLPDTIKQVEKDLGSASTIMDISSVKKEVISTFQSIEKENKLNHNGSSPTLLSCHPMVGSEKHGIEYADTLDFSGKWCLMIEDYSNQGVSDLMMTLGFQLRSIKSGLHDELLAASSHFPYLLACLASKALERKGLSPDIYKSIVGSGFLDTTRISASNSHWGVDICRDNKEELLNLIDDLEKDIIDLKSNINQLKTDPSNLEHFFSHIQAFRSRL